MTGEKMPYSLAFSHVGFFVADMDRMTAFYTASLGFFVTDRGVLNGKRLTFLSRDPREHHQIVLVAGRDPAAQQNINQVSFRVGSLTELKAFHAHLVAGNVQLMFTSTVSSLPLVKAGKLRALAISSDKRSQAAPELPTVSESGLPGYESATWFALFTPTGTPHDIIVQLNSLVNKTAQVPEIRDALLRQGAEPEAMTPEQVSTYGKTEIVKWAKVVATAGVKRE